MILGSFLTLSSAIFIPIVFTPLIIAGSIMTSISLFKYLTLKSIDMGITNKRVIFKEGLFSLAAQLVKNKTAQQTARSA